MTIIKNGNSVFSGLPIFNSIQNNYWYILDITDPAYGIGEDIQYPFSLTISNSTSSWIQYRYPVSVGYIPLFINQSHPMGSLEYISNPNYWIGQNYYYQQGGVFLAQQDGMVTKVVPLISVTNQSGIPVVRIIDIAITGSGNIGGTSPVQVISRLNSVAHDSINGSALASGIPNARNVTITVTTQDSATARMWNQTFAGIRYSSGNGIQNWITNYQAGNQASLSIRNPNPANTAYDVILEYTRVNLTVELQPVAI